MLSYRRDRERFVEYLWAKKLSGGYTKTLIRHLDQYVADAEIEKPLDIHNLFAKLSVGQSNNLLKALQSYLNFLELDGTDTAYLDSFRKALPAQVVNADNEVPLEQMIIESLRFLPKLMPKHQAAYNLCLDSGLRAVEAERLIVEFDASKVVEVNGFFRYSTGWVRGNKQSFCAYFTKPTHELLLETAGAKLSGKGDLSNVARKHDELVAPKYLRKFAFDAMISEELAIPESVADFIEGRSAKKVGARHYTKLIKQADGWYPRYGEYISKLRAKTVVAQPKKPMKGDSQLISVIIDYSKSPLLNHPLLKELRDKTLAAPSSL